MTTGTCSRCGERDVDCENIRPEDPSTDLWCKPCLVELVGRIVAVLARAGGASAASRMVVDERFPAFPRSA